MHILELKAENFKRLQAVEIHPKDRMVVISGRNAQGKSSAIDAAVALLGGAAFFGDDPIRHGTKGVDLSGRLGDLKITRRITKSGATLVVTGADGVPMKSPQAVLDKFVGALAFDPMEFSRQKPKEQAETLRRLVPLDVDLDALDADNRADFLKRTDVNREIKQMEGQLAAAPIGSAAEPWDVSALMDEHKALADRYSKASMDRGHADRQEQALATKRARIETLRKEAEEIRVEIEKIKSDLAALSAPEDLGVLTTAMEAVNQKIKDSQAHNAEVEKGRARRSLVARLNEKQMESDGLTVMMEQRNDAKTRAMERAKMPVPGLAFTADAVLYNGVPLSNASSAEKIRVSTAIAMAANPALKVLFIREGSFLDSDGMALLESMAQQHDYHIWIERVSASGEVGIVIEDGLVVVDYQGAGVTL